MPGKGIRMEENKENTGIDKWKIIAVAGVVVAVAAAIVMICLLGNFYGQEMESEDKMEELRVALEPESIEEPAEEPEQSSPTPTPKPLEKNPYADLFLQNGDMAFWLVVDGTAIDYPVVQTPEDENYYLNRDFYGNEDKAGCLILDVDSQPFGENQTTNLIIHGHNMRA